jgi:YD repeat-containing protein
MTIAQQLGVTKFPFVIKNDAGKEIYREQSNRCWIKEEYNDKGQVVYFENNSGLWSKYEYDYNGNLIYNKNSKGYWWKKEFDDKGKVIYFEDNTGRIVDSRLKPVPEYTMEELVNKLGHNFKIKK